MYLQNIGIPVITPDDIDSFFGNKNISKALR